MTLSKPAPGTEVLKDGWFYDDTYLEGDYGDAHRALENRSPVCTLMVRHVQVRRGPSGRLRTALDRDALRFDNDAAMVAWIEEHDAEELPPEADGNPQFVPAGFAPEEGRQHG